MIKQRENVKLKRAGMGCSDAVLCVARENPRRGFSLFSAEPKIHPFLRFRTLREFR